MIYWHQYDLCSNQYDWRREKIYTVNCTIYEDVNMIYTVSSMIYRLYTSMIYAVTSTIYAEKRFLQSNVWFMKKSIWFIQSPVWFVAPMSFLETVGPLKFLHQSTVQLYSTYMLFNQQIHKANLLYKSSYYIIIRIVRYDMFRRQCVIIKELFCP